MKKANSQNIDKCIDVISSENCSLIIFCYTKEISGMLQIPKIRFSLTFNQKQLLDLLFVCEDKPDNSEFFKIFKHPDELYPIILQMFNNVRIFLSEQEWQDLCSVIAKAKEKHFNKHDIAIVTTS